MNEAAVGAVPAHLADKTPCVSFPAPVEAGARTRWVALQSANVIAFLITHYRRKNTRYFPRRDSGCARFHFGYTFRPKRHEKQFPRFRALPWRGAKSDLPPHAADLASEVAGLRQSVWSRAPLPRLQSAQSTCRLVISRARLGYFERGLI